MPKRVEVLVVGGGITGVSLLRRLGERGVKAALIERTRLAFGASGRNAGFLLEGTAANYAEAIRLHGRSVAREVWDFTGQNHRRLAQALGGRAGYRRRGSLTVAASPEEEVQLKESAELMVEDGWPVDFEEGSILNPRDGELYPAEAVAALAADCPLGSIFEKLALDNLEQPPIAADEVILATNAFTGQLLDGIPITPVRAQMLATAPFPDRVVDRPTYSDHGYRYWRQLQTGEVLVGGYRDRAVEEEVGYGPGDDAHDPGPPRSPPRRVGGQGQGDPPLGGDDGLHSRRPAAGRAAASRALDLRRLYGSRDGLRPPQRPLAGGQPARRTGAAEMARPGRF